MKKIVFVNEPVKFRINLEEPLPRLILDVLRKYNMQSFKLLTFSVIPELRHGRFEGLPIRNNRTYTLSIPFDNSFTKLYGIQKIMFKVDGKKINILVDDKTEYVFRKLYSKICRTYKGVPIIDEAASFKAKLLL